MTITDYFWLNGYSNASLGFWVLEGVEQPILPETIDSTIHIRGRPGQYRFASDMDARQFSFECQYEIEDTAAALLAKLRQLTQLLINPDGSPKMMTLVIWVDTAVHYNVQYANGIPISREIFEKSGRFTLTLVAFDPIGTGETHSYDETITTNYQISASIPYTDVGNVESRPVISLTNNGSATIDRVRITVLQTEA